MKMDSEKFKQLKEELLAYDMEEINSHDPNWQPCVRHQWLREVVGDAEKEERIIEG